jgi:hypothetical protein
MNTGKNSKPATGDILVQINGIDVPLNFSMQKATNYMQENILRGPVELVFAEDETFYQYFQLCQKKTDTNTLPATGPMSLMTNGDLIEILDD